jgi:delta(3,5)-delta(2,4)-dienoyl-CoA isomerase
MLSSHCLPLLGRRLLSSSALSLTTLRVSQQGGVASICLHRPSSLNSMTPAFFSELQACFSALSADTAVRCAVLSGGEAKGFTSGLDLPSHAELLMPQPAGGASSSDSARKGFQLRRQMLQYQAAFSCLAAAPFPVIAAVHGACIGGGVDLACAADIRLATADASLRVAEARLGLCADLGTLQRLPRLVGSDSWAREVCLTARSIPAAEALARGLLSGPLYPSQAALREGALAMAAAIAALSPVAVLGTKSNLNFARDHGVGSALAYQAAWSAASLLTEDIGLSMAAKKGQAAEFKDVP